MRKQFVLCNLLCIVCLFMVVPLARAASFQPEKKYRIESYFDKNKYNRSGALGLGTEHGAATNTYYVTGNSFTADCWWYVEDADYKGIVIKNGKKIILK